MTPAWSGDRDAELQASRLTVSRDIEVLQGVVWILYSGTPDDRRQPARWEWWFSSCRTMIALGWPAASKLSQVYFGGTK